MQMYGYEGDDLRKLVLDDHKEDFIIPPEKESDKESLKNVSTVTITREFPVFTGMMTILKVIDVSSNFLLKTD